MSDVDPRRLRNLTARDIIGALVRDGFELFNQKGSHQRFRHADGRRVTVTFHHPIEGRSPTSTGLDGHVTEFRAVTREHNPHLHAHGRKFLFKSDYFDAGT